MDPPNGVETSKFQHHQSTRGPHLLEYPRIFRVAPEVRLRTLKNNYCHERKTIVNQDRGLLMVGQPRDQCDLRVSSFQIILKRSPSGNCDFSHLYLPSVRHGAIPTRRTAADCSVHSQRRRYFNISRMWHQCQFLLTSQRAIRRDSSMGCRSHTVSCQWLQVSLEILIRYGRC